jgi:hypothetical protein
MTANAKTRQKKNNPHPVDNRKLNENFTKTFIQFNLVLAKKD